MRRIGSAGALALTLLASAPMDAQQPTRPGLELPVLPRVTLTVLVDIMAGGGPVLGEVGLSFFADTGDRQVLFDTGVGQVLLGNARALEVDLEQTDAVVLSHGHGDHTLGLTSALGATGPVDLYVHPAAFAPRWARSGEAVPFLTLPLSREQLRQRVRSLVETVQPTLVVPGVMVTGQIPRVTGFEETGFAGNVFLDADRKTSDLVLDDQALFFRVPEGIVIVLGCAHAGLVNTMRYVSELLGEQHIYAVIGGTHLVGASPERMRQTMDALRQYDVQKIMLSHCTGLQAYAQLAAAFPGRVSWPGSGEVIQLGRQTAAQPAAGAPQDLSRS